MTACCPSVWNVRFTSSPAHNEGSAATPDDMPRPLLPPPDVLREEEEEEEAVDWRGLGGRREENLARNPVCGGRGREEGVSVPDNKSIAADYRVTFCGGEGGERLAIIL